MAIPTYGQAPGKMWSVVKLKLDTKNCLPRTPCQGERMLSRSAPFILTDKIASMGNIFSVPCWYKCIYLPVMLFCFVLAKERSESSVRYKRAYRAYPFPGTFCLSQYSSSDSTVTVTSLLGVRLHSSGGQLTR